MIALLQGLAIIGLGAAAVFVLRYQPPGAPSDATIGSVPDGASAVGHDGASTPEVGHGARRH